MALDICFDVKTFLERTCRACSRYFNDEPGVEKVKFHRIFTEMSVASTFKPNLEKVNNLDVDVSKPSDEIREVYGEFLIWKLNIKSNDGLPQQICQDCMNRFSSVKSFRKECLDTQKVLESYFKDFDTLLESGSLGKLSPKTESVKSESKVSPEPSFNAEQLEEELPDFPERLSPFRFSPRFQDSAYADSILGTPPPLFEEIKTEPLDMQTMEVIKAESELLTNAQTNHKQEIKEEEEKFIYVSLAKKSPLTRRFSSSDDGFSMPTSDEEQALSSDTDSESESTYDFSTDTNYGDQRNSLQCKICFAIFPKRFLLKEHHLRVHPQEKPYSCNICTSTFKSNFLLSQHKLKHNRPDSIKCELCSKYFRSQLHLQRHTKNFHLTSTYTCHICNDKFEKYTQIRFQYHLRQHGEKRFGCEFCEKCFHQKIHLINHERTHTKEQPFHCDICGKSYRQKSACQEHILKHTDPTPFKCKICLKGFTQRSTLRMHYPTHTANKPFSCEHCAQTFVQKVHYELHQLSHSNNALQSNECKLCKQKFRLASQLEAHMQIHVSMVGTQVCGYCSITFKKQTYLDAHIQAVHRKIRTQASKHFKCQYCN